MITLKTPRLAGIAAVLALGLGSAALPAASLAATGHSDRDRAADRVSPDTPSSDRNSPDGSSDKSGVDGSGGSVDPSPGSPDASIG